MTFSEGTEVDGALPRFHSHFSFSVSVSVSLSSLLFCFPPHFTDLSSEVRKAFNLTRAYLVRSPPPSAEAAARVPRVSYLDSQVLRGNEALMHVCTGDASLDLCRL
jgi:hypothetical protein